MAAGKTAAEPRHGETPAGLSMMKVGPVPEAAAHGARWTPPSRRRNLRGRLPQAAWHVHSTWFGWLQRFPEEFQVSVPRDLNGAEALVVVTAQVLEVDQSAALGEENLQRTEQRGVAGVRLPVEHGFDEAGPGDGDYEGPARDLARRVVGRAAPAETHVAQDPVGVAQATGEPYTVAMRNRTRLEHHIEVLVRPHLDLPPACPARAPHPGDALYGRLDDRSLLDRVPEHRAVGILVHGEPAARVGADHVARELGGGRAGIHVRVPQIAAHSTSFSSISKVRSSRSATSNSPFGVGPVMKAR